MRMWGLAFDSYYEIMENVKSGHEAKIFGLKYSQKILNKFGPRALGSL